MLCVCSCCNCAHKRTDVRLCGVGFSISVCVISVLEEQRVLVLPLSRWCTFSEQSCEKTPCCTRLAARACRHLNRSICFANNVCVLTTNYLQFHCQSCARVHILKMHTRGRCFCDAERCLRLFMSCIISTYISTWPIHHKQFSEIKRSEGVSTILDTCINRLEDDDADTSVLRFKT